MDTCSIYRDCFNYYLYDICGGSRNQLGKEMDISPSDVGKMLKRFKQGGGMGQNADKVLYHLAVEHGVSIDFLIDRMLRNNLVEEVGKCEGYFSTHYQSLRYNNFAIRAASFSSQRRRQHRLTAAFFQHIKRCNIFGNKH